MAPREGSKGDEQYWVGRPAMVTNAPWVHTHAHGSSDDAGRAIRTSVLLRELKREHWFERCGIRNDKERGDTVGPGSLTEWAFNPSLREQRSHAEQGGGACRRSSSVDWAHAKATEWLVRCTHRWHRRRRRWVPSLAPIRTTAAAAACAAAVSKTKSASSAKTSHAFPIS